MIYPFFIVVPAVELFLLIEVGRLIGTLPSLGLIVATGFIGATLARYQGLAVLSRLRSEVGAGCRPPARRARIETPVLPRITSCRCRPPARMARTETVQSSKGRSSLLRSPSIKPTGMSACRYFRSVFGPILSIRAVFRGLVPIRWSLTSS